MAHIDSPYFRLIFYGASEAFWQSNPYGTHLKNIVHTRYNTLY